MQTIINSKITKSGIKFVAAVARRSSLPILENCHVYANGCFQVTATDLSVTLQARLPGNTVTEGKVTMPSRALLDAVAGKNDIQITADEKSIVSILDGGNTRQVYWLPVDKVPAIPVTPENAKVVSFPVGKFVECLKAIMAAQSTDESRYVLQGCYLQLAGGLATFVATDGQRLHVAAMPAASDLIQSFLIPAQTVKHVLRIPPDKAATEITLTSWTVATKTSEDAEISTVNHIRFDSGAFSVISTQIDGNYPDYKVVIPTEFKHTIPVNIAAFRNAVAVASKATSDKSNSVKLAFTPGLLTVTAGNPDTGYASAACPVTFDGEFTSAFNPRYLVEASDAMALNDAADMALNFIDELSLVKITNAFGRFAVIMPMRLS